MQKEKKRLRRWGALACLLGVLLAWAAPAWADGQAEDEAARTEEKPPLKLVAITFDDGPKGAITQSLLDGLEERGVEASFFLIGALAEQYPDLVVRMAEEGHQIGIHSYDHLGPLTGLNREDFDAQVERSRALIRQILGDEDRAFMVRPPYGSVDDSVREWAKAPLILWSIDPEDWDDRNVSREVEQVVAEAEDGDIILMHDIFPESVEAALQIIDRLHEKGFYFVTVEELFQEKGITPEQGATYCRAR